MIAYRGNKYIPTHDNALLTPMTQTHCIHSGDRKLIVFTPVTEN